MTKIAGSGSVSQRHGSADPDPDLPQNVMDPQHWSLLFRLYVYSTCLCMYAIVQIVYICTHTVFALGNFLSEVFA